MACIHSSPFVGTRQHDAQGPPPTTVFGFASQDISNPFSPPRQSSAVQRARSLLSDMLQNVEHMTYSSEEEDGYSSYTEEEEDDSFDMSLSQGDSSSMSSQPIAIPNHTYFKAEDQKDALKKLTAKRKWWSQQQPGSHPEKAQPAQLAAHKQAMAHHKYHKQTHHARGNQMRQA